MLVCSNCELDLNNCICQSVERFFTEAKEAEAKLTASPSPKAVPLLNSEFWVISKIGTAALVALTILSSSSCGQLRGSKGDPGEPGAQGPKGDTGSQGMPGMAAQSCTTQTIPGGVQVTCPDGSTSMVLNGQNGQAGTQVTAVKLCPAYVTTYPTSFPEYAFCISDKLYAVYWDGSHAFQAEIVPGAYASTSPQTCTFTVSAHCVVSQ